MKRLSFLNNLMSLERWKVSTYPSTLSPPLIPQKKQTPHKRCPPIQLILFEFISIILSQNEVVELFFAHRVDFLKLCHEEYDTEYDPCCECNQ